MENLLLESMYRLGFSCLGSASFSLGACGFLSGSSRGASCFFEFLSFIFVPHSSSPPPNLLANFSSVLSAPKPVFVPYWVSAGYSRPIASSLGASVASVAPVAASFGSLGSVDLFSSVSISISVSVSVAAPVASSVTVAAFSSAAVSSAFSAASSIFSIFEAVGSSGSVAAAVGSVSVVAAVEV